MLKDAATEFDLLGFSPYVEGLAELILSTPTPLTVGIFGGWGTGKTSFILMIMKKLSKMKTTKVVLFNPWQFQGEENLTIPLLQTIRETAPKSTKTICELKKIGSVISVALSQVLLKTITIGSLNVEQIENFGEKFEQKMSEIAKVRELFESSLIEIVGKNGKLVIFIDDMDRCLPETALLMLESIKLFLSVERVIFVIATDKKILYQAIEVRYTEKGFSEAPFKGEEYIEKFIPLPFTVPIPTQDQLSSFIKHHANELKLKLNDAIIPLVISIIGRNPRKIKRFLNVLCLLTKFLFKLGFISDPYTAYLTKLQLLQEKWPSLYGEILNNSEILIWAEVWLKKQDIKVNSLSANQKNIYKTYFSTDLDCRLKYLFNTPPLFSNTDSIDVLVQLIQTGNVQFEYQSSHKN